MDIRITQELLGETEDEADLTEWYVANGDAVSAGQPIAVLETSKTQQELLAPSAGTVQLCANVGDVVTVGTVVATVEG